jgi:type IV fimbrial biogenesis protein FimT
MTSRYQGASAGFTLLELLVAIGVAAIVAAIAVPAFRSFTLADRSLTQGTSLLLSLNMARSEAIKQDLADGVTVCTSTDGLSCNGTTNWAQGWIVLSSASQSAPISVVPALSTGSTLSVAPATTQVTFWSDGSATPTAFTLCDPRGSQYARYTQVALTGRVTATVGYDLSHNPLSCP